MHIVPAFLCAVVGVVVGGSPPTVPGGPPRPAAYADDPESGQIAGLCPGTGDCCTANGTPGCDDFLCCDTVCSVDPACCSLGWDATCAANATVLCNPNVCAGGCPGTGDCCEPNNSSGCNDKFCCDLVCTQNAFCCDGIWTDDCVDLARILCGDQCSACPGEGNCCLDNGSPGCAEETCCGRVCEEDPYCCNGAWDGICRDLASFLCPLECGDVCPAEGNCCAEHAGAGCSDPSCCSAVCADDPTCCSQQWSANCVSLAQNLCESCGSGCPGPETCCDTHSSPGCDDATCCDLVCAENSFCCFLDWDFKCVLQAEELCGDVCGATPVCPGLDSCCEASASAGCEDLSCCERVCADIPACCTDAWNEDCVTAAEMSCGASCLCESFGDFDASGGVDLRDVGWLQRCFTGTDAAYTDPACGCGDLAGNGTVDLRDYGAFSGFLVGEEE